MKHYDRAFHLEQFESEKTCNAMLKFFLREVPEHLATLLTTVNKNDITKASFIAKTIRSAAKLMGADAIENTASELDDLLNADNPPLDYDAINTITELCSRILEQNKILGDIAAPYLKTCPNSEQQPLSKRRGKSHTATYKTPSSTLRPLS